MGRYESAFFWAFPRFRTGTTTANFQQFGKFCSVRIALMMLVSCCTAPALRFRTTMFLMPSTSGDFPPCNVLMILFISWGVVTKDIFPVHLFWGNVSRENSPRHARPLGVHDCTSFWWCREFFQKLWPRGQSFPRLNGQRFRYPPTQESAPSFSNTFWWLSKVSFICGLQISKAFIEYFIFIYSDLTSDIFI